MKKIGSLFLYLALIYMCLGMTEDTLAAGKLLQQSDLEYLGAFRVPQGTFGSLDGSVFDYGGTALTYNSHNNSLILVGHNWHQLTAEISIPKIVKSTTLADLKTATVLQNFADITEGNRSNIGEGGSAVNTSGVPIGGYLVWGDSLIGTAYGYYDAGNNVKLSHFRSGLDFSATGDFQGMYAVGTRPAVPNPAFIDGYMATIPQEWQTQFGGPALTGNCCLSIIGRTSLGPSAAVFNPDNLGVSNPLPVTPIVGYPIDHPTLGTWGDQHSDVLYNGSMAIHGMVFPQGSNSVLFFGSRGTGDFCYGEGVDDPALDKTNCDPDYPDVLCCYDPVNSSKGGHSYPYVYLVLAYDVKDLLLVKNGVKKMWQIVPYDDWELTFPFAMEGANILGAAYDPLTQRIYLSEDGGDRPGCCGHLPLIQVYRVNLRQSSSHPISPGTLFLLEESK